MPAGVGVVGRGCVECAQFDSGGVVRMDDGNVTFKGGTISRAVAVRVRICICIFIYVYVYI